LQGPSGAAALSTSAQPEFRRGWRWLRSWAVKDGVTVTDQALKSLYDNAMVEAQCGGLASLLVILKDEVAAAL
jgi:hypothetical protein